MLSRRVIQRFVDHSGAFLQPTQARDLVRRLNSFDRDAIEAEWELIVLSGFASLGRVEHEPSLGGTSRPDIRLLSSALGEIVADVRTVSDEEYDRQNPAEMFARALDREFARLRNQGVTGMLYHRIHGNPASVHKGIHKTSLRLPRAQHFKRAILGKPEFRAFLSAIAEEPGREHSLRINNTEADIEVVFKPGTADLRFSSYLSYNQAHDRIHNVVWRALERKAEQLKQSGVTSSATRGVILCDGGCGILRASPSVYTRTLADIVLHFLRGSQTVDFVTVVDIPDSIDARSLAFDSRTWSVLKPSLAGQLDQGITAAFARLPRPQLTPVNTLNRLRAVGSDRTRWGERATSHMAHNKIEISLRAAMDYLAGRTDRTTFEQDVHVDWLARLRKWLDEGRSIKDVCISKHTAMDDDCLVITVGEYDAASAPFRSPLDESDTARVAPDQDR